MLKKQKLNDLFNYSNGQSIEKYFCDQGEYEVISIGNYSLDGTFKENGIFVKKSDALNKKNQIPKINDLTMILNDKTGDGRIIGKTLLVNRENYIVNQRTIILSPKQTLNSRYFHYLINSVPVHQQIMKKVKPGTQIYLNTNDVLDLELCFEEDVEIQEKISNKLFDIDQLVKCLEELIQKKKLIKQGVMQEFVTGKKRLTGFTKEWKRTELGSLGKIYNGLTGKTKGDFGWGDSKYVTFLNVLKNRKLNNKFFEKVNIKEVQNFIRYGDLFFNTSSEIPEEVALCSAFMDETNENIAVNSFCFGFRLNDLNNVYPLYLVDYFRSNEGRKKIKEIAQGSTRYNLSKEYFLKLLIPMPEYEEQKAISTIISDIDEEINFLEQDLEKYKQIKQGMMEQLLTGKIKIVN